MGDMVLRRSVLAALGALLGLLLFAGLAEDLQGAEPHLAGSCDVRKSLGYCMEYRGTDWTSRDAQDDCDTAPDGAFSDAPCPSTERVGICSYLSRGTEGSRLLYVYYEPMEASVAKMSCPGTFTPAK